MSHPNARLIVYGRGVLVSRIEAGWTVSAAAHAAVGAAAPVPQDPQGPSASQGRSALPRMAPQDSPIDDLCGPEALRALTLKHPHVRAAVRYEWPEPGDMVHLDVKKLGRIPDGGGWRVHGGPGYRKGGGGW